MSALPHQRPTCEPWETNHIQILVILIFCNKVATGLYIIENMYYVLEMHFWGVRQVFKSKDRSWDVAQW
jgi:hypothetical protein